MREGAMQSCDLLKQNTNQATKDSINTNYTFFL